MKASHGPPSQPRLNELVGTHAHLVVAIARRFRRDGLDTSDLVQDGCIGLLRAAEKFDPALGHPFSVYARWWIRQHIFRAIADYGRTIRVPLPMVEASHRLRRARRVFTGRFGREPDDAELLELSGLDRTTIEVASALVDEPLSLNARLPGGDGETELIELVADRVSPAPDEIMAQTRRHERLHELIEALSPRERSVLRLRFGLGGAREHTPREIARALGLSRERVRRAEARALSKLRAWSLRAGLEDPVAA